MQIQLFRLKVNMEFLFQQEPLSCIIEKKSLHDFINNFWLIWDLNGEHLSEFENQKYEFSHTNSEFVSVGQKGLISR